MEKSLVIDICICTRINTQIKSGKNLQSGTMNQEYFFFFHKGTTNQEKNRFHISLRFGVTTTIIMPEEIKYRLGTYQTSVKLKNIILKVLG
jgi:hypothetical protein